VAASRQHWISIPATSCSSTVTPEDKPLVQRVAEITAAVSGLPNPLIPVVPVRMQEAWLLVNESALRRAAGNPNGRVSLQMPAIERLEDIPDPKRLLHDLLLTASELTGRRRKKQNPGRQAMRLGELIENYSPLRRLRAFQHAEAQTLAVLRERCGWMPVTHQSH